MKKKIGDFKAWSTASEEIMIELNSCSKECTTTTAATAVVVVVVAIVVVVVVVVVAVF